MYFRMIGIRTARNCKSEAQNKYRAATKLSVEALLLGLAAMDKATKVARSKAAKKKAAATKRANAKK